MPVLTNFAYAQKKNLNDNERFQNGISNGVNNKHSDKSDSDNFLFSEINGNLYINGNGTAHEIEPPELKTAEIKVVSVDGNMKSSLKVINPNGVTVLKEDTVKRSPQVVAPDSSVDPSLSWKLSGKAYLNGPDQILPSTAIYTCNPDGAVRLPAMSDHPMAKRQPVSVPSLLKQAADRNPDKTALAIKRNGEWQKWSYRQYHNDVRAVAKGFIALGLERYHSVCILGFNTPEWFQADLAAIFAGGFAAGIYTTNTPEACAYCAIDSKANIFVVEDEKQLAKVLQMRDVLTHLKAIIQYTGEPTEEGVLSWSKLLMIGNQQDDSILEDRLSQLAINQCCTLIYTSGTTGNPKGVMLSHDNLTWTAQVNAQWCGFQDSVEEYISFLPLSHVAAQMADIYCPLTCCASVYFGDKNALKGSLIDTMKEIKPTKFLAVPRVWEKMYEKMQEVGRSTTGVKKTIATWAKSKALDYNMKRMRGVENPETFGFKIANKLILSKIRDALGLTRCDILLSGAAPISREILKYFMSLNIVVTEVYGMSECSGPHCMAIDSAFRIGSCGKTLPGCVTQIRSPDADGNGEILMGGRHVSMGYLHQLEKTRAAIDSDGWLHSEDIGHVDSDGYLFITGRLKELLITAGGENVAPVPIEDNIKHELPFVSQAVVLGDRLKFLSILLTLKTEVDKDTQEPLDKLLPYTKDWIQHSGQCSVDTVDDVIRELYTNKNQNLIQAIQKGIDRANLKAVSQAQRLQKWRVLPVDFSIPGGELGPTMKLKRQTVYDKYKDVIEDLYR
ncbi:unnamed protein product [Allacma fusca]|uniref:long-chain-fatty-acid--CoA ligase n=1 Tax=Allacma fusca TaxID=39272 RepID=A0A8J2KHH1_9HEXA|nr:unnamed protein product [Allacma fusca]